MPSRLDSIRSICPLNSLQIPVAMRPSAVVVVVVPDAVAVAVAVFVSVSVAVAVAVSRPTCPLSHPDAAAADEMCYE